MFTGIIESIGKVLSTSDSGITIARPKMFDDIKLGSSISVSGVCLSVVELTNDFMRFDVVEETWSKTNLEDRQVGDLVNLERAMKADARLDGHVVQGHVEGVGRVKSEELRVKSEDGNSQFSILNSQLLRIHIPSTLARYIVPKGSISLDGVSLTVASVQGDVCTIALIPHTLENTTLGSLQEGDRVNIETDILTRTRAE